MRLIIDHSRGATVPRILKPNLLATPIPLPPLSEQKRIVAKVDRLMILCDALEEKIEKSNENQEKLLEAVVHEVVTGSE